MSSTRKMMSIASIDAITLACARQLALPVIMIDPLNMSEEESCILGGFLVNRGMKGDYFTQSESESLWQLTISVNDDTTDTAEHRVCLKLSRSILLRPGGSYPTKVCAEIMGPEIGRGTFGVVYRSMQTLTLHPDGNVTAKACFRVIKEHLKNKGILEGRRIEHESEMGIRAGYLHMKMPVFLKGKDRAFTVSRYFARTIELFDLIEQLYVDLKRYSTETLLAIVRNLLYAVQSQLHGKGILSRDIKPENILVGVLTGEIYNIDLGFSRLINEPELNEAMGSPGYAAPEAFSGVGMTEKSDVFPLGVSISYLLGMYAKIGSRLPDLNQPLRNVKVTPQENDALLTMLKSMVSVNPDERMSLNQAMLVVEKILLDRELAPLGQSVQVEMKQVYALAVRTRDEIDLSEEAMRLYASSDPMQIMDSLMAKLETVVSSSVASLPEDPVLINLYATTLFSERFKALKTRSEIQAMVAADIADYKDKKSTLDILRNDINAAASAKQEAGMIVTAWYRRVRALAPTIDNIPVLMRKLDKTVSEFRHLNHSIEARMRAGGDGGLFHAPLGLFNIQPDWAGRVNQGRQIDPSKANASEVNASSIDNGISMKNNQ